MVSILVDHRSKAHLGRIRDEEDIPDLDLLCILAAALAAAAAEDFAVTSLFSIVAAMVAVPVGMLCVREFRG